MVYSDLKTCLKMYVKVWLIRKYEPISTEIIPASNILHALETEHFCHLGDGGEFVSSKSKTVFSAEQLISY